MWKIITSLFGMALPSWIIPVSLAGGLMLGLGSAYIKGRHDANMNCQAESLKAELRILKKDIAIAAAADKQEAIAVERMDKENSSLREKVKTYVDGLTSSCVYGPGDIDRLRELRKSH